MINAVTDREQYGYLGYTTGWADGGLVTPLISGSANTDAMVAGVNISRRIVYLGDSQIFSYGMGYSSYAITWNNQNTLMANLWAWITTQLIYGDDLWGGDWAQ